MMDWWFRKIEDEDKILRCALEDEEKCRWEELVC